MSFSLKLLGGVALQGEPGLLTGPAVQRHRLALLAVLAIAHPRAVSRDKVLALLWPERETEPARRLLNQAVHALRQALGADAIVSAGDDVQLGAGVLHCDVVAFEEALAAGAAERAVRLYAGPFLDGFYLGDAPEFERWVDRERDRLGGAYAKALEGLAEGSDAAGDTGAAVRWWKARAGQDPYDSRVALRLMQALERAGNRAGALQHAAAHQQLLRDDLEIEQVPEVQALVERLRREPIPAAVSRLEGAVGGGAAPAPDAAPAARIPAEAPPATPPRRHTNASVARYAAVAVLLVALTGGAIRLVSGRAREPDVVATPKVVDEIAQAVASELERRQRGDTGRRLPHQRTRSIPAYELYLRASDPAVLRSDSAAAQALGNFRRAVELDPTYAAAWLGLARLTFRNAGDRPGSLESVRPVAEAALGKALALDSSIAEAHAIMGVMSAMRYDYGAAERWLRRAIELEPGRGGTREWLASVYLWTGRNREALLEAERAAAADPLSPTATAELARSLLANDRCTEALARLETIAALDPPLMRAAPIAWSCYIRLERWDDALRTIRPRAETGDADAQSTLGLVLARTGHREDALAIQRNLEERQRRGEVDALYLTRIPGALGETDQVFAWLDRAYHDGSLTFMPGRRPTPFHLLPQELRQDPRWALVLARLHLQNR